MLPHFKAYETNLLRDWIEARAKQHEVDEIVTALEAFGREERRMIWAGKEKCQWIKSVLEQHGNGDSEMLELGTYVGYTSLQMAAWHPKMMITSVEISRPLCAFASWMHTYAGKEKQIQLHRESARKVITDKLQNKYKYVFIDHRKQDAIEDLMCLQARELLVDEAIVMVDNTESPYIEEFCEWVEQDLGVPVGEWKNARAYKMKKNARR